MRSGVVPLVWLAIFLLVAATTAGQAASHPFTVERSYQASSTFAWGAPGQGGAFVGLAICNNDQDTFADTTGCVRYQGGAHGNLRGYDFEATLTDRVFDEDTAFLVGIDLTGNNNVDCTDDDGGPDACFFGHGTVTGTIPADADGEVLRVHPITVHNSVSPLCCPQSFATQGEIEIVFTPPSP